MTLCKAPWPYLKTTSAWSALRSLSFILTTYTGSKKRLGLRRLKNLFSCESELASSPLQHLHRYKLDLLLLVNLPTTTAKKFAYTDDLAFMYSTKDRKTVIEEAFSKDKATMSTYNILPKLKAEAQQSENRGCFFSL